MRRQSAARLLVYTGAAILAFLFVWFQLDLLLLAFAGVLFAVVLRTFTRWLEKASHLHGGWAYAGTLLLLGAALVGIGILLVPRAITQVSELTSSMPKSIHQLEQPLEHSDWGRELLGRVRTMMHRGSISSEIPTIADDVTGAVTDLVVVVVIGFFAALNPRNYSEGILLLLPEENRQKARRISRELKHQLEWWLLGQLLPMVVLGGASGLGLWLLGVHLPWTLGLITGVAIFLPYAGTLLAGIPSVLMGLQQGPHTALYVLLLYTALHLIEGYILTPMVQRHAVRLPPVLTILTQYFFWSVGGILGLAVAAPLASAGIVLVKELYLGVPAAEPVLPEEDKARQPA